MASELKVDKFTGVTTAGSIDVTGEGNSTTTNLQQGLAKSWFTINGTGTAALLDSFNVGSLTDDATGKYSANLTSAMSNFNYALAKTHAVDDPDGSSHAGDQGFYSHEGALPKTTSVASVCSHNGGDFADVGYISSSLHGDLA